MARKNIGAKPYIMPMPVLMLSAYEVENEIPCAMLAVECRVKSYDPETWRLVGEKVGNAYKDGLVLRK